MSRNLSLGFVIAAVVLVLVAVLEHFLYTGSVIVPHLGIILAVLAVVAGAVGALGMVTGKRSA